MYSDYRVRACTRVEIVYIWILNRFTLAVVIVIVIVIGRSLLLVTVSYGVDLSLHTVLRLKELRPMLFLVCFSLSTVFFFWLFVWFE